MASTPKLIKETKLVLGSSSDQPSESLEDLVQRDIRYSDFSSYLKARERVWNDYSNRDVWLEKMVLNLVRIGKFSSDRAIMEYAIQIWGVKRASSETSH
jgi:glycogen phosphorylase